MAAPAPTTTPTVAPPRAGLRATALLLAPQMAAACASLAVNVLAARTLGPSGRGHVALLLQVGYLTNMLAQAGTDRAYPVHAPPGRPPRAALADTARLVAPTGVLVVAAAVPVVAAAGGGSTPVSVVAFLVAAAAMIAGGAARTAAAATGTVRPYMLGAVTGQIVLVATAVAFTAGQVTDAGVWLAGYAVALACAPAVTWLLLPRVPSGSRRVDLRAARRLGLRLLPAGTATMIMLRADRLLLPALAGLDQLGVYIIVATVAELAAWTVQTWVDANTNRWHQQHLAGTLHHTRPLLAAAGYGTCAALVLLAAAPLIRPVFGDAYADAARLLPLLAAATVAYSVSRVAVGLGTAAGRARTALAADLPATITALGCYLLLIPRWGAYGAAAGSAIAYTVSALLAVTALARTRTRR
ncbi:polysaccharide biosynthesis C-terminal domain-containing protein [Micromonospora tulbaghiae]|uniref:polysaccharide biosynthesis C-terminal domain-containing protein n=1 Tax=Micromonospora tulbaghiae TaxID=479978 RepID=UPI0033E8E5C7